MLAERDAIRAVVGTAPPSCPWQAFFDPDVVAVLDAYDWDTDGRQIREWWGDDPPWWLVESVAVYRRALARARADVDRQEDERRRRARKPAPGVELEIER